MRVRGLPYPVMGMGSPLSLARANGGGGIITSIFADGTDGFYFDFSQTDRTFQNTTGTLADDAGENIGLSLEQHTWSGRTLAELRASQTLLLDEPFDVGTGWTVVIAGGTVTGGQLVADGSLTTRWYKDITGLVAGWYEITGDTTGSGRQIICYDGAAFTTNIGSTPANTIGGRAFVKLTNTSTIRVYLYSGSANAGYWDNITLRAIPGNHGLQASTSFQPKWQTGGLARFDGLDDNLLTTLNPAASFSMAFKGKVTSASKVVMGSRSTTDTRVLIGTDASGLLAGGVGADSTSTIKGGSDIRGTTGVGALVFDASTVTLYWNGASIYSGALNGSPNTTIALRLGAFNDNGTGGSFADADVYHALAIKKALTAGQIAAITNKWGTS